MEFTELAHWRGGSNAALSRCAEFESGGFCAAEVLSSLIKNLAGPLTLLLCKKSSFIYMRHPLHTYIRVFFARIPSYKQGGRVRAKKDGLLMNDIENKNMLLLTDIPKRELHDKY